MAGFSKVITFVAPNCRRVRRAYDKILCTLQVLLHIEKNRSPSYHGPRSVKRVLQFRELLFTIHEACRFRITDESTERKRIGNLYDA